MAMTAKTHTGLDFQDLAKGGERNYSCSYLVNLDPDLIFLTNTGGNFIDQVWPGHGAVLFWFLLPSTQSQLQTTGEDGPAHLEKGGSVQCLVRGEGTEEVLLQGLLSGETLQWVQQTGVRV